MSHNAYIIRTGEKNKDIVIFNPRCIELQDISPVFVKILLADNDFWKYMKSITWSSNCRYFFCIMSDRIIIGNCHDNEAVLCKNTSQQVFDIWNDSLKQNNSNESIS